MNQKKTTKNFIKLVRYIIITILIVFFIRFIPNFISRTKQLNTCVNMKNSSTYIDEYIKKNAFIKKEDEEKIYNQLKYKIDEWGNELIFMCKGDEKDFHYVLISKGSNEILDLKNINDYFILPSIDIHKMQAHDIVIRDGEYITNACK